ncbi:MAG: methyltransferase domain-containing protein [Wenzhouxiangella sp.]|jgi:malonyl-CoA O-methyltransferase|nr:methyltransferase domain-containing protein [Wenzhouxiangella sp.]
MAPDSFQEIAKSYEKSAAVAEEAGRRLLERLDGLRFEPKTVIEVGCATGRQLLALHQRYPKAVLIGIDYSFSMLKQAARRKRWWRPRFRLLQAEASTLPLPQASADLVFINLTPSWLNDPASSLSDLRRVLRPGGLLLISAFGPDTLRGSIDHQSLMIQWTTDVQGLGRELVRAGFSEPVLDTDWLTTTHSSHQALSAELCGAGLLPAAPLAERPEKQPSQPVAAQWEIVSASAWAPDAGQPVRGLQGEEVSIPISQIGRRQRD